MTEQKDTNPRDETYSIPPYMVLSSEEGLAERHFNLGREKGTNGVIIDGFELTPVLHLKLRYSPKKASG